MSGLGNRSFAVDFPNVRVLAGILALTLVAFQLARVIYSAFFSPLSRVPGPLICKITGGVDAYQAIIGGRRAEWMHGLHSVYGQYTNLYPGIQY